MHTGSLFCNLPGSALKVRVGGGWWWWWLVSEYSDCLWLSFSLALAKPNKMNRKRKGKICTILMYYHSFYPATKPNLLCGRNYCAAGKIIKLVFVFLICPPVKTTFGVYRQGKQGGYVLQWNIIINIKASKIVQSGFIYGTQTLKHKDT